jgi:glutathionyl-hydroquinone reductase
MMAETFSLGRESGDDGSFRRQDSRWRLTDVRDFPVEAGRYHLYVARACPWAHRTIIVRRLMGLEDVVGLSFVDPIRDQRGWGFTGNGFEDPLHGWRFLSEAYFASDPGYEDRVSVPVLWDKQRDAIVCNESADIIRLFATAFAPIASHPVELCPQSLLTEIEMLNDWTYDGLNNGVYKAGFSSRQDVYEDAVRGVFEVLDDLDARLAGRRFLFGTEPVETDWRVFTTLVRFDAVYNIHFKCSVRKIAEYRNLWPYLRDLYQWPGIAETVSFDEIRAHYYGTHPMLNPSGLVAVMPALDFDAPPGREGL